MIYLEASVDTLMEHINRRGRDYERNMSPEYLARLNRLYNEWIGRWKACEVLHIKIDGIDFQHNADDFAQIRDAIGNHLLFMNSH